MTTLYRAYYDFTEIQKGEIVLIKNDVILFIKQVDNDWFYGLNISSNEEGLMPRSFVEPCLLPKLKYHYENFMDNLYLTISSYDSSHPDDLNFDSNEIIFVTKNEDENWMYGVNCFEKEGLFPKNFVKKIFLNGSSKDNVTVNKNDFPEHTDSCKTESLHEIEVEKNIISQNIKMNDNAVPKIDLSQKEFVSKGIALIDINNEEIENFDTYQELVMKENDEIEIYELLENGKGLGKNINTQQVGKVNLEYLLILEGHDPIGQSENKRKFDWWKEPAAEFLLASKPYDKTDSAPRFEDQTAPLFFTDEEDSWQNNDMIEFYNYSDDKTLEKQFYMNSSVGSLDNYIADDSHSNDITKMYKNDSCSMSLSTLANNTNIEINSKSASLISSNSVSLNESKDSNCLDDDDDNTVFIDAEDENENKESSNNRNFTEKLWNNEDLVGLVDLKNATNVEESFNDTINDNILHSTDALSLSHNDNVNYPDDKKPSVDKALDSHNDKDDETNEDRCEIPQQVFSSIQDNNEKQKIDENLIKPHVRSPKPLPRTKSNSYSINNLKPDDLKDNTHDNDKPSLNIFNVKPCFDVIKESIGLLDAINAADDTVNNEISGLYETIDNEKDFLHYDTSHKYDLPPENEFQSKQEDLRSYVEDNIYEQIDGEDACDDDGGIIKDLKTRIKETEATLEKFKDQRLQLIQGKNHEGHNIDIDSNASNTEDIHFVQANIDGLTQEMMLLRNNLKRLEMNSSHDIKLNYDGQLDNIYENDQNTAESSMKHKSTPKKKKRTSRENKLKNNINNELSVEERKKKRTNLIEEILITENEYLSCLQACQQTFQHDVSAPKEICEVFKDLSLVINCSKNFLKELDNIVVGKAFDDQLIGKCFKDCNEDMKSSYSAYCTNFEDRIAYLNTIEKNPAIKTWVQNRLEALKRHFNVFDLPSILIKPLQRILKYPLFISQLIKCTSIEHKDFEHLLGADECLKQTNMHINELKRRRELVRRYKKSDESWFWSKFNIHSIKKKVNRLLTPGVHLEHFGVFEKDFRDLFMFTKDLSLRVHTSLLTLKAFLTHVECLIGEMAAFVNEHDNDFKNLTSFHSSISSQFFPHLESKVRKGLLVWLNELQTSYLAPRLLMRKRHHKLKDFVCAEMAYKSALNDLNSENNLPRFHNTRDFMTTRSMSLRRGNSKSSVSKGSSFDEITEPNVTNDQIKLLKKDLEKSRQDYEALNDQLCEELPTLFRVSYDVLGYCVYYYNVTLRNFYSVVQTHFKDVFKDSQVFEAKKGDNFSNIVSNFNKDFQLVLQKNLQLNAVSFSFTNPSSNTRKMSSFFVDFFDNNPVTKLSVTSKRSSSLEGDKSLNETSNQSHQKSTINKPPLLPPRPTMQNKLTK